MAYVAYYWKPQINGLNEPCVRYIERGFACTQSELPNEMKIRCGAVKIPEWEWVSCIEHANVLVDDAVSRGFTLEEG